MTINNLEARFAVNSADAVVTYFVCHLDGESTPSAAGRIPTEICSDIDPFEPGMPFEQTGDPRAGDALYVTITPSRPGVARLTSVKVSYATGSEFWFRRGSQDLDIDMKVTAR